ncbi:MAG: TlpA disulfide reductase family protein [Candidatus Poribacteria bacterium]|nr:TlpA disulfide reductase family protein [Candidatus Poribacteria bacterium]
MLNSNHQQDLAIQIEKNYESGEFEKALEISAQALESNPPDLKAYSARWKLIVEMLSEADARKKILPEIEYVLSTHPEKTEALRTAFWGYMRLPGDEKNVPNSLFDEMLQYPKTENYQTALFILAKRSENTLQKWDYYERVIDEFTTSDAPIFSWYWSAHSEMLRLVETDRSLASDDLLDELIERCLKAHLFYCRETQQWLGWAYTDSVKWRLKFNVRLDKALETLERAEIRLGEQEEQTWLIETNEGSVEEEQEELSRLRSEIYLRQERWREAHDGLVANAPDFLESVWARFKESSINYFYMLGRSAEGLEEWETARRYYADAHFALTPHVKAQAGLQRVFHQIEKTATDTYEAFLGDTEAEYRGRESADLERIRQKLITPRRNQTAPDFRLQTLEGESYTLSAMSGKVVLLDVGASWCGPCNMAIPEVKTVYKHFSKNEAVVIWGINDGEAPQKVREFLNHHHPPWPVLLDPQRQVREAYEIEAIPFFVLIDKVGNWQYTFNSSNLINGQPLIWMVDALLSE